VKGEFTFKLDRFFLLVNEWAKANSKTRKKWNKQMARRRFEETVVVNLTSLRIKRKKEKRKVKVFIFRKDSDFLCPF